MRVWSNWVSGRSPSLPLIHTKKSNRHGLKTPLLTLYPPFTPTRPTSNLDQSLHPLSSSSYRPPLRALLFRLLVLHLPIPNIPTPPLPLFSRPKSTNHMPTNRSFFSQFIGSLIGFRPRSPSSGGPIKATTSAFSTSSPRRRSTSSLNSAGSGGGGTTPGGGAASVSQKDRDLFNGEKWWIGGRRADGSERYYPIAPLRYTSSIFVVEGC